jgi:hypothetical protein
MEKFLKKFPFLEDRLYSIWDFLEWTWYEVLTVKSVKCFLCDKFNFYPIIVFIFSIFVLILAFVDAIIKALNFHSGLFSYFIDTALIIGSMVLICTFYLCRIYLLIQSYQYSLRFPQSVNLSETDDHIAIIFPHYTEFRDELFVLDCIALLVRGFQKANKKFRIYHIYESKNFTDAYRNPKVTELWIIGHGSHGIFAFDNKQEENCIVYSKLEPLDVPKKSIVQLHCNNGEKLSLKDINGCDGFVNNFKRAAFHNRCYIMNKIKKSTL